MPFPLRARRLATAGLALMLVAAGGLTACSSDSDGIKIGLITKTETNPFFVKMKEGAQAAADEAGVELMAAAGKIDGDNEGQVTAIENMMAAGVKGIMITPNDTEAIVPSIKKARDAGIAVIALDTPAEPEDATDALFATDNYKAGVLIGEYAKALLAGETATIATLDLAPGVSVGELRHDGFIEGFGIEADDPAIVCSQDTLGDQAKGQTAMENCLQSNPDINLVYTINEPAGLGAYTAIEAAGKESDITIVSVDGGCDGVDGIADGKIAATSQQYPLKMAELGVEAIVANAKDGKELSGYTDTGVNLIAAEPIDGIESEDVAYGKDNCWG